MIPFAAYTAAETPSGFLWAGQPQKIAPSRGGMSTLHVVYGFLGPPESTLQSASRSVQPFLQGSRS